MGYSYDEVIIISHYGTSQCVPWVAISCWYLFLFFFTFCLSWEEQLSWHGSATPLCLPTVPQPMGFQLQVEISVFRSPSPLCCVWQAFRSQQWGFSLTPGQYSTFLNKCHFLNKMCASSQPSHLWPDMSYSEVINLSIKEENILYYLILWSLTWHQCFLLIPSSSN